MSINRQRAVSKWVIALVATILCAALVGPSAAQPPVTPEADPLAQPPTDEETQPGEIPPLGPPGLDPGFEAADPNDPNAGDPDATLEEEGPDPDAELALGFAQQALFAGDYDAAFEAMDEALGYDPDYAEVYLLRSFAHRLLGEYQQAIDAANRALELDPENSQAFQFKAWAHIELNQTQAAVAATEAALAINPDDANAMFVQGTAYFAAKNYARAVTALTDALGVSPRTGTALQQRETVTTYMRRGMAWYHLGEYDIAIDDFNVVIRLSGVAGVQDEGYRWRGFVLAAQGDFLRAIHSYDRALHVNRRNSFAHKSRGIAYLNLATTRPHLAEFANAEAIGSFNQMIRLDPDEARAYYYRGIAYSRLGEPRMAHSSFSTAAQMDPDHAAARRRRDAIGGSLGPMQGAGTHWVLD